MVISTILKNFKGFQNETIFPVSKLNLLTGINGRGKSSFLQSILLIRQSIEEQDKFEKLIFNGSCVNLGTFYDVKNSSLGNDSAIEITHKTLKGKLSFVLKRDEKDDMIGFLTEPVSSDILADFRNIHYVAADRVGPQEFYLKSTLPKFINVGTKGEFVANVLLQKKEDIVHDYLVIKEKKQDNFVSNLSPELLIQTGEWISKILDTENVKVNISNNESSRVITLSFGIGQKKDFRPSNIGFGYTYILPIVVSGLIAKDGEILIVENPEAHLHPKAQSNLVEFLSLVASCGIQVFIESHSEHILNSLIISSLKKDIKINNTDISTFYFTDNKYQPFFKLNIESDGSIDNWPEGFFDQQEIDLAKIFKLGRNK